LRCATQARFTACRVAKLSQQSMTTSAADVNAARSSSPTRAATRCSLTSGLIAASRAPAASTFERPMSPVA
jgi:hypothetical protein